MERRLIIRQRGGNLEVRLHVAPRARATALDSLYNGVLKLRIAAPPVDGAANRAIVDFFAGLLEIPRSRVAIASGDSSREKRLEIRGVNADEFRRRLPEAIRQAVDTQGK